MSIDNHAVSAGARCACLCTALAFATTAAALEITPGDYEPLPADTTALLLYYQHAERSTFRQGGDTLSDDFRMRSDIGLLRLIHGIRLADRVSFEPQFILPFGHLHAAGEAAGLGQASGLGDLILGAPLKFSLDTPGRDVLAFGPYLYLPTGRYHGDDALNLGENRWRLLLQAAYIHHFSERWAVDTAADVSWFSRNHDFGASGAILEQKPTYEYQAYLRYQWTPRTTLGFGGGHIEGGRTRVDGVDQDDRLASSYLRLTIAHFIEPTLQVQLQWGKDVSVEQGFEERSRVNLRLTKLF
ncbi:Uncharacterized conserved protein [Pseudomonas flavescens]|uniref:Uncharacterized conserved protein n=1 Tax=Phytopseudomonas flavescens TaxID=29435 RepID=A0A1G8IRC8_9GAMM|nr:transporter [Pseudomonas flavescens]SDI21555.1 Uncharacterized conserved protein [Pseudomonas flavescens]